MSRVIALAAVGVIGLTAVVSPSAGRPTAIGAAIYSIRPDGTGRTLVSRLDPPVSLVLQSPDGQKIAFERGLPPTFDLYVSEISGTEPVQIHPSGYPRFSPDGTRLALSNDTGLWVVNTDDTNQHTVADHGGHPSWSPDGSRLVFASGAAGRNLWDSTISVVSAEGGGVVDVARGLNPEWAPRGNRIAYLARRGGYAVPCFVNSDGSHRTCYRSFSVNGQFIWSPNGKRLAFRQASPSRIAVASADGRHLLCFPVMNQRFVVLAWSPDGRWLAYSKESVAGRRQLYVRPVQVPGRARRVVSEEWDFQDVHWRRGGITYVLPEYRP